MSKLWTPSAHNWFFLKKKACLFIFDCLVIKAMFVVLLKIILIV